MAVNKGAFQTPSPYVPAAQTRGEVATWEETVEHVYRQHASGMWRAVLAFSQDPELARDAVAEAFAQALARGEEIRDPRAWLWRAAFRIAAGQLKERGRHPPSWVEETYEMPVETRDLIRALAKLSPKQRSSLILHHYAGYPVAEVAEILDSTPGAVRVHLHRGRKRLRTMLEGGDD